MRPRREGELSDHHAERADTRAQDLRRAATHPDFWYPLAWSEEVEASGGGWRAVRGRTSHPVSRHRRSHSRIVPPSPGATIRYGIIDEQDAGECGYHGWAYNCAGKCMDVPYLGHERLPNGVRYHTRRAKSTG